MVTDGQGRELSFSRGHFRFADPEVERQRAAKKEARKDAKPARDRKAAKHGR